MATEPLPETVQTLYAELLDQSLQAEAEAAVGAHPPGGSFVSKEVKGHTYWYLQRLEASRKRQHYLGPDSPALRAWMAQVLEARTALAPDQARRAELVSMLIAGGAVRERPATAKILRLLAEAGVFRLGGVLVGTQAFTSFGNMLGVRLDQRSGRTEDVDVAQDPAICVAVDPAALSTDVGSLLKGADSAFFPVPGLDPRSPSTSFKVRGRDLRVDLLAPGREGQEGTVPLPLLRAAAQPLPFLGYLLAGGGVPAVVLDGAGILVRVPDPARFALHKLWLARQRPVSQQSKAGKDLRQAAELIQVLQRDRPADLTAAWRAVPDRRRRPIREAAAGLDPPVLL